MGGVLGAPGVVAANGPDIQVTQAWIRWLPAGIPSGGYMTLTNTGTVPRVLIGADSADFADISLHQTRTKNGMSDMAELSAVKIEPQSSVRFAPGGYHLMLMQPKRALHPGDRVRITLHFADGAAMEVPFAVRSASDAEAGAS
jgi:copper(I)-binding protein